MKELAIAVPLPLIWTDLAAQSFWPTDRSIVRAETSDGQQSVFVRIQPIDEGCQYGDQGRVYSENDRKHCYHIRFRSEGEDGGWLVMGDGSCCERTTSTGRTMSCAASPAYVAVD